MSFPFLPLRSRILSMQILGHSPRKSWTINTSNQMKVNELTRHFGKEYKLTIINNDLKEIKADSYTVAAHKAYQAGLNILVDDASLDVEGADIGINLRWKIPELEKNPKLRGRVANWATLLAYQPNEEMILIFRGAVKGKIIEPR